MDYINILKKHLNKTGKTQIELAKSIGMTPRRLSKLLCMHLKITAEDLEKIEKYCKDNL